MNRALSIGQTPIPARAAQPAQAQQQALAMADHRGAQRVAELELVSA